MSDNLEINIEEIIHKIREEIREKGYQETDLSFEDIPIPEAPVLPASNMAIPQSQDDLRAILDYLNANCTHDIMLPIESSNPVKKIVRKLVRFLFYPVLARQNEVNASLVNALAILTKRLALVSENEQRMAELQGRVDSLEAELEKIKDESGRGVR